MAYGEQAAHQSAGGAVNFVAAVVAAACGVQADALRRSRGVADAHARQLAMYLAHTSLGLSLTDAGGFFGRDRTTVALACRAVETRRDDPRMDQIVHLLERALAIRARTLRERGDQR